MKASQHKRASRTRSEVGAQLENRALPEEVSSVGRIVRRTLGLALRGGRRDVSVLLEATLRVGERPLLCVHLDARQQSANPRQCVAQLRETQPRIAATKPLVEHHLFGVMRPAVLPGRRLRKRIQSNPDSANLARRLSHVRRMQPMAGHRFMRGRVRQRRIVVSLEPFLLLLRTEVGSSVRDIENALHRLRLERRRRVHRREAEVEGQRRGDDNSLARRDRRDAFRDDEGSQRIDDLSRRGDHATEWRMILTDGEPRGLRIFP